jgi:hypothetical protein
MAQKEVTLTENIREFSLSTSGDHLLIRRNDDLYLTTPEQAFKTKATGERSPQEPSRRIIARPNGTRSSADTWRWCRDFFYDENMHGRDWKNGRDLPVLSQISHLGMTSTGIAADGRSCACSHTYKRRRHGAWPRQNPLSSPRGWEPT